MCPGPARYPVVDHEFADRTFFRPAVERGAKVVEIDAERVAAAIEKRGLERQPERPFGQRGRRRMTAAEAQFENVCDEFVRQMDGN